MSYCRWSSDGWACDVYCYEGSDGFHTHVAGRKRVHPEPCPTLDWRPDITDEEVKTWLDAEQKWLEESTLTDIGLPHDGESFTDSDAEDCADRLEWLRDAGYHVPQYAIDELREEAAEMTTGKDINPTGD